MQDVDVDFFVQLTKKEKADVKKAFSKPVTLVCTSVELIQVTPKSFRTLKPRGWLDSDVINFYLHLLKERERREPTKFLKCHYFSTFFYVNLVKDGEYNFMNVKGWTKNIGYKLNDCDRIFVPIHKAGNHWCLAVINKKDENFEFLDSDGGNDDGVLTNIAKYYVEELVDKSGINVDVSSWTKECPSYIPTQENNYDCGVFMIKYADFRSSAADIGFSFVQADIPYFRLRVAKELLEQIVR